MNINASSAAFVIDITIISWSGQTLRALSGSAIAGSNGFFEDRNDLASNDEWHKAAKNISGNSHTQVHMM